MIRKLLATTAMAGLFATGAFAQETTTPAPAAPAAQGSTEGGMAAPAAGTQADAAASAGYIQTLSAQQHLVSELDGKEIYSGAGQDAQSLGSIENWLVEQDGTVSHAIVQASVNDQNRTVAVPFDQIKWSMDENNEPRATIDNADTLANAPVFMERQQTAAANDPAVMGGTTAPAGSVASTTTAPAAGGAMTPAPAAGDMAAAGAAPAAGGQMAAGAPATGETMMQSENQFLTSNLMDQDVRTGMGDDAETIGKMSDFVVSDSGKVDAAIVGVGGFLGIGQKNVAVPFADFQVSRNESGEPRFVLAATKDQLEQAQAFEGREQATAANTATGSMGNDMAAAGAAAGAATGAAVGGAMNSAQTAANNAGTAMGNAADGAMNTAETAANNAGTAMGNAADGAMNATENVANTAGAAMTGAAADTDPSTTASTGNAAEGMTPVQGSEQLTADQLKGTTVYGPNDESIGKVGDIALNADGRVDSVIVDVGGFLGIGAKPVAVGLDNVRMMRDGGERLYIYTEFSKDQLENAPAYDQSTYAANRDTMRLGSQAGSTAAPAPAAGSTTAN